MTAIIAAASFLAFTIALFVACIWHDRARNLETLLERERADHTETLYQLDDAERERDRYRYSNSRLIEEASTMSVDLMRAEDQLAYFRACHRRSKDVAAGTLLLSGLVREDRKMRVYEWSSK